MEVVAAAGGTGWRGGRGGRGTPRVKREGGLVLLFSKFPCFCAFTCASSLSAKKAAATILLQKRKKTTQTTFALSCDGDPQDRSWEPF